MSPLGASAKELPWTSNLRPTRRTHLDGGLVEIRRALELDPNLAAGHVNLAMHFSKKKEVDKALTELRRAMELDPASATVHNNLGALLSERGELDEAISELRKALALQPRNVMARANLAGTLAAKHDWHGALTEYRRRIEMDPGAVEGYLDLARYLADRNNLDDAIAELRRAVQLDLMNADAHHLLGLKLHDRGRPTEAVAELRTACRLRPTWADPHTNLARFFLEGQDVAAALTEVNLAVALEPESGEAQTTLAGVLVAKGAPEEARLVWERALERSPASHDLWNGYAELCLFLGKDDAYRKARRDLLRHFGGATQPNIAERVGRACLLLPTSGDELKQAVALVDRAFAAGPQHPDYPYFQAAKALAEYRQDRPERALPHFREAAPRVGGTVSPNARLLQAMTLWRLGQKKAGREMFVFAVPTYPWRRPGDGDLWIHHVLRREAEAMIVPEMPAFLKGDYRPEDAAGWAALTSACYAHGLFVTMARRLAEAIAADPSRAEESVFFLRYSGACACALAGAGQGEEARGLSPDERAAWRRQALQWLHAELASQGEHLDRADRPTSAQLWGQLQSWIRDTDLTPVRDRNALAGLPDAEQKAWRTFWSDVQALSKKAETQARVKK